MLDRRIVLASAAATLALPARAALFFDAAAFGVRPGSEDMTAPLQKAIDSAAGARSPLHLGPGSYRFSKLTLQPNSKIVGVPGATRLVFTGADQALFAARADGIELSGLTIEGNGRPLGERRGLVTLINGRNVRVSGCECIGSGRHGIMLEAIEGSVSDTTLTASAQAGLFSLNARGLLIRGNVVRGSGNNGILVWRSDKGDDGTRVADNLIEDIAARDGGSGQNGNAINVFRAGGVTIANNRIRGCAFSAVRANSTSDLVVSGNSCTALGEVAIYAEFAFDGATISGNTINGASVGISATNFNEGGRLATISGNTIRNLVGKRPAGTDPGDVAGVGIVVEADAAISGNVIDGGQIGMVLGFGPYLRDVNASGNTIRNVEIGVGISVVKGAGRVLVANNLISAGKGIVGMEWKRPVTEALTPQSVTAYPHISLNGNFDR